MLFVHLLAFICSIVVFELLLLLFYFFWLSKEETLMVKRSTITIEVAAGISHTHSYSLGI